MTMKVMMQVQLSAFRQDFKLQFISKLFRVAPHIVGAALLFCESPKTSFVFGTVETITKNAENTNIINKLDVNSSLLPEQIVASGTSSRAEFIKKNLVIRLGSLSVAKWLGNNDFWIHSGSVLFCIERPSTYNFFSPKCKSTFSGKGTIIIEATSNGGYKFIPLEAKGTLSTEKGGTKEIIGGRLILVLGQPTEFGDAYDIDIMLMLKSSRLINAFPSPLSSFEKIGLAVYVQELKMKGKYDALIGDATTNENLQMWKFGNSKEKPHQPTNKP